MFFYANGGSGSSHPLISIQKQSAESLIRMLLEINHLRHADSERVELKSNSVSCVSHNKCSLGCHRVIRFDHEKWIVNLSTSDQLKDEALGFVKDGWTTFEIKIKLFDEKEFDEEIKRIARPLGQVSRGWEEPDPHERMHVEGLFLNDVFPLRCLLNAEGRGRDSGIDYTSF